MAELESTNTKSKIKWWNRLIQIGDYRIKS